MKKLNNTEAELRKCVAYKKGVYLQFPYTISLGLFLENVVFDTVKNNLWKSDNSKHTVSVVEMIAYY